MFYDRPDFPVAKVYIIGPKPKKYVLDKAIHHGVYPRSNIHRPFGWYAYVRAYFARDIRDDPNHLFVSWFNSDMTLSPSVMGNPTPRSMQILVEELDHAGIREEVLGALRDHTAFAEAIKPDVDRYFKHGVLYMRMAEGHPGINTDEVLRQEAAELVANIKMRRSKRLNT